MPVNQLPPPMPVITPPPASSNGNAKKPSFFDEDDDESFKPPQKGITALTNQNNLVNAYNNTGANKGDSNVK